jgi:8-oxo-dGTP pyrophosphatase MutT (NUDIX family)
VIELTAVLLVDRSGRVLLQLRDGDAPNWPHRWGLPGGHVETGESFLDAGHRELLEETGLRADLVHYTTQNLPEHGRRKHYLMGATAATAADVILGEGAAMVFTAPADALDGRPFTPGTVDVLGAFFDSPAYQALAGP